MSLFLNKTVILEDVKFTGISRREMLRDVDSLGEVTEQAGLGLEALSFFAARGVLPRNRGYLDTWVDGFAGSCLINS